MAENSAESATNGSDGPPAVDTERALPWQSPKSRVNQPVEEAALACVRQGRRDEALKALMAAYGAPLTAFALRILHDRELAKDVHQQVFLEVFQAIDRFESRGSLWSWLCSIAYHRCLDELRRVRRTDAIDQFDVLDGLAGTPHPTMDEEQIAKQRALEQCLGKLSVALRTQLLMRYFLGLSYVEIGEAVGAPHGTVQVRMSRILPQLRRCLRGEGVTR